MRKRSDRTSSLPGAVSGKGRVRIIAGTWRRRQLSFPAIPGLRPTPDRVRETLFNWLGHRVVGAHCVDLFAGSGALGLEAASRGAASVTLVEQDQRLCRWLREQLVSLRASTVTVAQQTAAAFLAKAATPLDLVFLDPPFNTRLLGETLALLSHHSTIGPETRIYIETGNVEAMLPIPENWVVTHGQKAGQVRYYLASLRPSSPS